MACGQQCVVLLLLNGSMLTLDVVVDFYNQINLLYGAITEFCSPQSCPEMKATDEYDIAALHMQRNITDEEQVRVPLARRRELQASN